MIMSGHPKPNNLSIAIGLRLKKLCEENYKNKSECARAQNMAPQNWTRVESGKVKFDPDEIFKYAAFFGVDPGWLLTGRKSVDSAIDNIASITSKPIDQLLPLDRPMPNAIMFRKDVMVSPPRIGVIGEVAAKEVFSNRAGFFDDGEPFWSDVEIPETTRMVKVKGDSMSPVILDGQYAMTGPEYAPGQPIRHRDIVIVSVSIHGEEQAAADQPWEGVYCKRIQDGEGIWYFTSINETGDSFSISKSNCRIWPVIGVWFAGQGEPPED
jgi:transcriptional regulator with XRE-family HTH domain